ncbi:MAG: HlyD family efflux transporter periplasmic adaptor subunit [Verrucomicrobia bacterium]|nr:HlyD family efflux transporter periplasmic adaptor subunit [Verrucomicrobiota bacterium]
MKTIRILSIYTVALLMAACSRPEAPTSGSESTAEAPSSPNSIDINPTVRNNLGITFAYVERRRVADTLRVPGVFELRPLARHEYRTMLAGRVDLMVDQYQDVAPGDLLYRYQSPAWTEMKQDILLGEQAVEEAKVGIEVARARLEEGRAQLERMQQRLIALEAADFGNAELRAEAERTQAALPRLEAELRLSETKRVNAERMREHALHRAVSATGVAEEDLVREVDHAGERVPAYRTLDWIDVRAMESGVVEHLSVTDGAFVEPPALVVTTVDPSDVRFRATALQSDLPHITAGTTAHIVPPRTQSIPINDAIEATISIGLEAHPDQRTMTVIAMLQEMRPWIHPGVSAFLEIPLASTGGAALAIPRSAVVQDGISHVFFRRDPGNPNRAIRVDADMGVDDGRWVEIHSGLSPNDEVVLDGAYELKLATARSGTAQKGGHFHADGEFHAEH